MADWSAGVSTTHNWPRSRCGSAQVSHTSCSVKVWHWLQWRTAVTAWLSACARMVAACRSCCSRWKAMRCADLTPTPGTRLRASTRAARAWVSAMCELSERQLHAGRQAGGELAHLLLRDFFGLAQAVIEGSGHQVFEHVLVVGQQAGVDVDAAHLVLAGHQHLDQTGAGLAFDLDVGQFVLGLLEVILHGLGLLHEAGELSFVEHVALSEMEVTGAGCCRARSSRRSRAPAPAPAGRFESVRWRHPCGPTPPARCAW